MVSTVIQFFLYHLCPLKTLIDVTEEDLLSHGSDDDYEPTNISDLESATSSCDTSECDETMEIRGTAFTFILCNLSLNLFVSFVTEAIEENLNPGVENTRKRKLKADRSSWFREKNKEKRMLGKNYIGFSKKKTKK